MNRSGIQWTDFTWNPVTGCTKVSPGCANCYAERTAKRLKAMGCKGYEKGFNNVVCHEDRLSQPARRKKPSIVFCCSMSDLFHEDVPDMFIAAVFGGMYLAPQHEFIILTKRPERIAPFLGDYYISAPPRNLRIGVSVENQATADERIPVLMDAASKYGFKTVISMEPLLERVFLPICICETNWIIAGCESGKSRRVVDVEAFYDVIRIAEAYGIRLFIKQASWEDRLRHDRLYKMPELGGKVWDEMPLELAAMRKGE